MQARIRAVRWEAQDILGFRLEPLPGEHFAAFTAGAHVDVALAPGLTRSYSLLNDPAQGDAYEIAVQLDPTTRGGSRHIHEQWRAGQCIEVSAPRNNFPLFENASRTILVAGGIGITPMLSMIARLERLGRAWELHYAVRTRERAAFIDRLEHREAVHLTIDDEPATPRLDLQRLLVTAPADTHVYCCGPAGMLDAFREHGASWGERLHFEYFSADTDIASEGGYRLELRRSRKTVEVQPGETMLDALLNAGVNIGFACSEGICGSCRAQVLDGVPDHRDHFLTPAEKAANCAVMVCCSGSRTPSLTLDL